MESWSLTLNAVTFLLASAAIWWSGTTLESLADRISHRTGLGQDFTGMLLLAAATSLPEVATTVTAVAILGNASLAVHNLLGGIAMQTIILVIADGLMRRNGSLTYFTPRFSLLVQGVGLVILLQIAIAGITAEGVPEFYSISLWLMFLLFGYLGLMYLVYHNRGQPRWTPNPADDVPAGEQEQRDKGESTEEQGEALARLWLKFGGASLIVLGGGWWATQTAEVLAEQTGLGPAFLGATLLATATSLPEVSTTIAAVRNGRHTVAISNVFGSNAFDVTLLVLAEVLYREGTILENVESSAVFVAAVGTILTCIYLWGLMERENRTIARLGLDSVAATFVYLGAMAVLYSMR